MQELNITAVRKALNELGVPFEENTQSDMHEKLAEIAEAYEYDTHDILVDLSGIDSVNCTDGIVITYKNSNYNDGTYIMCIQSDYTMALVVLVPNTVERDYALSSVVGDFTSAITGVETPPLMAYDQVVIASHVIAKAILKPMAEGLNIPEENQDQFIKLYMTRFLADVSQYYLGSSQLSEETVNLEPNRVKMMIQQPEIFMQKESIGDSDDGEDA